MIGDTTLNQASQPLASYFVPHFHNSNPIHSLAASSFLWPSRADMLTGVGANLRALVARRAAVTTTADTLDRLVLGQLVSGHAADACRVEVRLFSLNAAEAAKL